MTFPQVLVYIWLGQALLALLPWNVDKEIAEQIRSGGVAYELLRPVDLYGFWFARTLAFRAGADPAADGADAAVHLLHDALDRVGGLGAAGTG